MSKRLKVWLSAVSVALAVVLILTLVPADVTITNDGILSIGIRTVSANPDWLTGYSYCKDVNITAGSAGSWQGSGQDMNTLNSPSP